MGTLLCRRPFARDRHPDRGTAGGLRALENLHEHLHQSAMVDLSTFLAHASHCQRCIAWWGQCLPLSNYMRRYHLPRVLHGMRTEE
eukprot:5025244-Amphidinium_carterae.1